MRRFLKETWELWYWAMFCPSRLQERMNDWSAEKSTRDIANFRPILISSKRTSSGFSYGLQHPEFRDVGFRDILLDPVNWRFFSQFFSLVSLFSLPLAGLLTQSSTLLDWLLLPSTPLIAYGLAFWFLPVSLYIPIVIALLYGFENQVFRETMLAGWLEVENIFPPFSQVAVGICMGVLLLALTNSLICSLLKRQSVNTARLLFIVGVSLSTILGAWISTQSLIVTGFIGFTVGTYSYFFQDRLQIGRDVNDVAAVVAGRIVPSVVPSVVLVVALGGALVVVDGIADGSAESFAFGASSLVASLVASLAATGVALFVEKNIAGLVGVVVALLLAVVVGVVVGVVVALLLAVVVAVVITVFSKTELLPFLAIAAVLAFSLSYGQRRWSGLIAAALLAVLGVENLGWRGLWVLPVTISFYYRLLPDYIFFAPMLLTLKLNFLNRTSTQGSSVQNIEQKLSRLPPFSSELLWLPLPGHAQLLAGVFQRNATFGLSSLKKMQLSILPGLPQTVKDALPDIVADQLLKFNHVAEFESLESEPEHFHTHPLLRTLLPRYFDITQNSNQIDYPTSADLSNIFPRLQRIAEDVAAALQSENLTLRERGLERVLEKLNLLTSQLPGLGLKTNDIKRWQPVISRWLNLIEIELSEQKKLSRRELRNPFQYGNPLQRTQGNLFKGRQDFADNIVRLLLNHNRPTIVLHGPRRCGKTSFLNNLPRLLPSDWVPIYVDMQSAAATADEISFLRTLARSIRRDGRSQGISIPDEPDRGSLQAAPYDTFETWLEAVLTELSPRQLLLNLDEFEKISAAIDQGKLSLTLFDELRSLIQHWPQLGFVFSGVQTLEEIGPNWSSYFISVVPIEILYLNPQEAQQLLTDPDPDFALTYAPGLVDGILQLTQCHPNLLQLIGAALVTEANERHTTAVTATMLEAAIPRALTLGTSYFTNVWDEFTGTLNTPDEIRAGQTILKAMAEGQSLPSNLNSTARAALRRMVRYHVLKVEDGHYDFEIPLIKRWVQERAILDE